MSNYIPSHDGSSRVLELCYNDLKLWDFIKNDKISISLNRTLACCWIFDSKCVFTLEYGENDVDTPGVNRNMNLVLREADPVDNPCNWKELCRFSMNGLLHHINDNRIQFSVGHMKFGVKEEEQYVLLSLQGHSKATLLKVSKNRTEMNPSETSRRGAKNESLIGARRARIQRVGELDIEWSMTLNKTSLYESDIIQAVWKMGDYDYEINDVSDDRLITSFHGTVCIWNLKTSEVVEAPLGDAMNGDLKVDFVLVEQLGYRDILDLINNYNRKNSVPSSSMTVGYIMSHLVSMSNQIFVLVHDSHSVHVLHIDFMKYCFHSLTSLKNTAKLMLSTPITVQNKNLKVTRLKTLDNQRINEDHFVALEAVQCQDGNSIHLLLATSGGRIRIYDVNTETFLDHHHKVESCEVPFPLLINSSKHDWEVNDKVLSSNILQGQTKNISFEQPTLHHQQEIYIMNKLPSPCMVGYDIICLPNFKRVNSHLVSEHHYTILVSSSSSSASSSSLVCSDSSQVLVFPSAVCIGSTYAHKSIQTMEVFFPSTNPQKHCSPLISSALKSSVLSSAENSIAMMATSSRHWDQFITLSSLKLNRSFGLTPTPLATIDVSTSLSPLLQSPIKILQLQDQYGDETLYRDMNIAVGMVKITAMAFSLSGNWLATGDNIGDIRVYELMEKSISDEIQSLDNNTGFRANLIYHSRTSTASTVSHVTSLQWSDSCRHLLVSLMDGRVLLALKAKGFHGGFCLQDAWSLSTLQSLEAVYEVVLNPIEHEDQKGCAPSMFSAYFSHSLLVMPSNGFSEEHTDHSLHAFSSSMTLMDGNLHCYVAKHQILSSPISKKQSNTSVDKQSPHARLKLQERWQSAASNMTLLKLDSPCTGLTKHHHGPYLIATTLKGTVILYHMFTKELRGVFSTKASFSSLKHSPVLDFRSCFRYPQVDPSGIYIAVAASLVEVPRGSHTSFKVTSHVEIYQIFTGKREANLVLPDVNVVSLQWLPLTSVENIDHGVRLLVASSNAGVKTLVVPLEIDNNIRSMLDEHVKTPSIWDNYQLYIPPLPKSPSDFRSLLSL